MYAAIEEKPDRIYTSTNFWKQMDIKDVSTPSTHNIPNLAIQERIVNAITDIAYGQYVYWEKACIEFHGLDKPTVLKTTNKVIHSESAKKIKESRNK